MAIVPFIINELTIINPSTARDIQPILSHKMTRLLAGNSSLIPSRDKRFLVTQKFPDCL